MTSIYPTLEFSFPFVYSQCTMRESLGMSARRFAKDMSRGPKGLKLEVGAQRAPKLLVYIYNC